MKLVKGKLTGGGAAPGKGRAGVVEQPKKARAAGAEQGPECAGHGAWRPVEGSRGPSRGSANASSFRVPAPPPGSVWWHLCTRSQEVGVCLRTHVLCFPGLANWKGP